MALAALRGDKAVPAIAAKHPVYPYLVAIMDWATRKVLSWRTSNTMRADFCVVALPFALHA